MPKQAPRHNATKVTAGVPVHGAETANARGYNYRWQKARLRFLRRHPLCVDCERRGRTESATQVDHIVPHRGDYALMWSVVNWQPLCASCHSRKTVREDGGFGR